jgi:hypothetical protein
MITTRVYKNQYSTLGQRNGAWFGTGLRAGLAVIRILTVVIVYYGQDLVIY